MNFQVYFPGPDKETAIKWKGCLTNPTPSISPSPWAPGDPPRLKAELSDSLLGGDAEEIGMGYLAFLSEDQVASLGEAYPDLGPKEVLIHAQGQFPGGKQGPSWRGKLELSVELPSPPAPQAFDLFLSAGPSKKADRPAWSSSLHCKGPVLRKSARTTAAASQRTAAQNSATGAAAAATAAAAAAQRGTAPAAAGMPSRTASGSGSDRGGVDRAVGGGVWGPGRRISGDGGVVQGGLSRGGSGVDPSWRRGEGTPGGVVHSPGTFLQRGTPEQARWQRSPVEREWRRGQQEYAPDAGKN